MDIVVLLVVTLGFPLVCAFLVLRQILRPKDDTFLQHEDDWGGQ